MSDMVVFGASCCWWDWKEAASKSPNGLPCCPHCGGVLHELKIESWWLFARQHSDELQDTAYIAFLEWLRGRCFPHVDVAREKFDDRCESEDESRKVDWARNLV